MQHGLYVMPQSSVPAELGHAGLHLSGAGVPQLPGQGQTPPFPLVIAVHHCAISLLLDSHLANIQHFFLKVRQTRFQQNYICSGNSHKILFAPDSDSTPNFPGIPPRVWCTTEWHHTNTKRKSCSLVWMRQSHAMSNFHPFSACCSQDNATTSIPSASLFSQ